MKKIIRLTESDLTRIIRRVINETTSGAEAQQKITTLRSAAKGEAKMSPCWTKGMCPRTEAGKIYRNECEVCAGPIAGILIPTIGVIAGAIITTKNRSEQRQRQEMEQRWITSNPELEGRSFTYFKDGSVQAVKEGFANDIMILKKGGTWEKLSN
jgi:hypothetical protein